MREIMTASDGLIFLLMLSAFTTVVWLTAKLFEHFNLDPRQILRLLKLSTVFVCLAPMAFVVLKCARLQSITIPSRDSAAHVKISPAIARLLQESAVQHWPREVFAIYLLGVLLSLAYLAINYLRAVNFLAAATLETHLLDSNGQACRHGDAKMFRHPSIASPLTFGIFSRKIYLPLHLRDPRELEMALAHEGHHVRAKDSLWRILSLAARSILFFHPFSILLNRKFDLQTEIVCDLETCKQSQASLSEYGALLLKFASMPKGTTLLTNQIASTHLQRRIIAMKSRKHSRPLLTVIATLTLLLVGVAGVAATGGLLSPKQNYRIEARILVDGKLVSTPKIIAQANSRAEISSIDDNGDRLMLDVTANNYLDAKMADTILLKIHFDYVDHRVSGELKTRVLLLPGRDAILPIGNDGKIQLVLNARQI